MKKWTLLIFCAGWLAGCATTSELSTNEPENPEANLTALGNAVPLNFELAVQIKSDSDSSINFQIPFPSLYSAPMYVTSDGTISMIASEFPRIVYRVCQTDSTDSECMAFYSGLDDTKFDIDFVIDSCGKDISDKYCGDTDGTIYNGILSDDGSIYINGISLRIRIFYASSSPNGYTATATNTGLTFDPPLSRMTVNISTANVSSGSSLSATGSRINDDGEVTLVSAGIIPYNFPAMGGAHYVSSLTGTFDIDPLSLLE